MWLDWLALVDPLELLEPWPRGRSALSGCAFLTQFDWLALVEALVLPEPTLLVDPLMLLEPKPFTTLGWLALVEPLELPEATLLVELLMWLDWLALVEPLELLEPLPRGRSALSGCAFLTQFDWLALVEALALPEPKSWPLPDMEALAEKWLAPEDLALPKPIKPVLWSTLDGSVLMIFTCEGSLMMVCNEGSTEWKAFNDVVVGTVRSSSPSSRRCRLFFVRTVLVVCVEAKNLRTHFLNDIVGLPDFLGFLVRDERRPTRPPPEFIPDRAGHFLSLSCPSIGDMFNGLANPTAPNNFC